MKSLSDFIKISLESRVIVETLIRSLSPMRCDSKLH